MDNILKDTVNRLAEAIQGLSKQVQELQKDNSEESEELERFGEEDALLEFTLVTSGSIRGKIKWMSKHSLGVRTDTGQDVILYKNAIALVQKQVEE